MSDSSSVPPASIPVKETTKVCSKCKEEKPVMNFYFRNERHKYYSICKQCCNTKNQSWVLNNPRKHKELCKQWEIKNPEKRKAISNKWNLNNKEKVLLKSRKWRKNHKQYFNQYWVNRRKNNPIAKFSHNMRSKIHQELKNNKSNHSEKYLMNTWSECKKYIESKWLPGMNWNNYGKFGWHIDHIIPCAFFDLKDETEIYMCFRYENLQPLWWKDNIKKGKKLTK